MFLFKVKKYNKVMSEPEYMQLNPVCNIFDEQKIMRREHQPYLLFGGGIGWETVYNPVKCYFSNIDITNIKDYALDKFLK